MSPRLSTLLREAIDSQDVVVLCGLGVLSTLLIWLRVDAAVLPYEDAAILLRYVQHLADGHGFVWNIGEPPLDGATDFLLVVITAGLVKAGLPLLEAMRGLGATAHVLTVLGVYFMLRRYHGSSRWIAGISALFLALGPGTWYIEAGFGTPVFAFLVVISYALLHTCIGAPHSRSWAGVFSLSCLLMGMLRPEGVWLAGLMLLSLAYVIGWPMAKQVVLVFLGIFLLLGGAFFAWRWQYFGHPLPLPYYVKGGGQFHFIGLKAAVKHGFLLAGAYVVPYLYGWLLLAYLAFDRSTRSRPMTQIQLPFLSLPSREALFPLIPLMGFTLMWVLVRSEMNFMGRFQYALLPMMLTSFPPLLTHLFETLRRGAERDGRNLRDAALIVLILAFQPVIGRGFEAYEHHRDGRYDVAQVLSAYADNGYTLATTEAGLLSLYSGWKVLDCWGLNDYRIAREGRLSTAYLAESAPEVIMIDAAFSPAVPLPTEGDQFLDMTLTMHAFAEENQYLLAASFGISPYNTHYYYVRPDLKDAPELLTRIRQTAYFWYENSQQCIDYAR